MAIAILATLKNWLIDWLIDWSQGMSRAPGPNSWRRQCPMHVHMQFRPHNYGIKMAMSRPTIQNGPTPIFI